MPIPNRAWSATDPNKVGVNNAAIVYKDPVTNVATRGSRFPPSEKANGVYTYTYKDVFATSRNPASFNFDVVRSVVPVGTAGGSASILGDIRLIAAKHDVPVSVFDSGQVLNRPYNNTSYAGVHSMRRGEPSTPNGIYYTSGGTGSDTFSAAISTPTQASALGITSNGAAFGSLLSAFPAQYAIFGQAATYSGNYYSANATWNTTPPIPEGIVGIKNSLGQTGDWDNGPGLVLDGPLCNKADEGADKHRYHGMFGGGSMDNVYQDDSPYIGPFTSEDYLPQYASFFSPNRMVPSPVMLGSLPTGVKRGLPWQTLLFRPAVSYLPGNTAHPGGSAGGSLLPGHALLDLFWMPVVDPYAISEPMATAGKINMNYQIVPFAHI